MIRSPYCSAYAWLIDARTPAELAESGHIVASLDLSDTERDRLRGFYQYFANELSRPDAVERGLVQKISTATAKSVATFWVDNQAALKMLDANGQGRVWDEIERRQPPKERKWGRVA